MTSEGEINPLTRERVGGSGLWRRQGGEREDNGQRISARYQVVPTTKQDRHPCRVALYVKHGSLVGSEAIQEPTLRGSSQGLPLRSAHGVVVADPACRSPPKPPQLAPPHPFTLPDGTDTTSSLFSGGLGFYSADQPLGNETYCIGSRKSEEHTRLAVSALSQTYAPPPRSTHHEHHMSFFSHTSQHCLLLDTFTIAASFVLVPDTVLITNKYENLVQTSNGN